MIRPVKLLWFYLVGYISGLSGPLDCGLAGSGNG